MTKPIRNIDLALAQQTVAINAMSILCGVYAAGLPMAEWRIKRDALHSAFLKRCDAIANAYRIYPQWKDARSEFNRLPDHE